MKAHLLPISLTVLLSLFLNKGISQTKQINPVFNHVFLQVSNLDSSIKFYTEAFDLKITNRFSELEVTQSDSTVKRNLKIAFLKFPNQDFVYELAEIPNLNTTCQSGLFQHVGIEVNDIVAAFQRVVHAGGKILVPIRHIRTNSGLEIKQAHFKGPNGEQIELVQVISGEY